MGINDGARVELIPSSRQYRAERTMSPVVRFFNCPKESIPVALAGPGVVPAIWLSIYKDGSHPGGLSAGTGTYILDHTKGPTVRALDDELSPYSPDIGIRTDVERVTL